MTNPQEWHGYPDDEGQDGEEDVQDDEVTLEEDFNVGGTETRGTVDFGTVGEHIGPVTTDGFVTSLYHLSGSLSHHLGCTEQGRSLLAKHLAMQLTQPGLFPVQELQTISGPIVFERSKSSASRCRIRRFNTPLTCKVMSTRDLQSRCMKASSTLRPEQTSLPPSPQSPTTLEFENIQLCDIGSESSLLSDPGLSPL